MQSGTISVISLHVLKFNESLLTTNFDIRIYPATYNDSLPLISLLTITWVTTCLVFRESCFERKLSSSFIKEIQKRRWLTEEEVRRYYQGFSVYSISDTTKSQKNCQR